jgi:hypothetical protein
VDSPFDPAKKKETDHPKQITFMSSPATIAVDVAIADTLDEHVEEVDFESPDTDNKYELTDKIIALLKTHFGEHPTFNLSDANNIMKKCVRACIDDAGSGDVCFGVLNRICTLEDYEDTRKSLSKSRKLGGYIQQSFPGWFVECANDDRTASEEFLDDGCRSCAEVGNDLSVCFEPVGKWRLPSFREWLKQEIGTHLIGIENYEEDGNTGLRIKLSQTYKAARILGCHTGQNVNPDALPDREDLDVAEVVLWATDDQEWGERLKSAPDAEEFFIDHFKEMHRGYDDRRKAA